MSQLQVVPADMSSASDAVVDAASEARGHDSAGHLAAAAAAVPGASSVEWLGQLGDGWDTEVDEWSDAVQELGESIAAASGDAQGADGTTGGLFGALGDILGWPR
jgi:uncharacterized protein YukE